MAGPDEALLDGVDLFIKLCPQIEINFLQLECSMELELGRLDSRAAVAIGCADDGIVEVRVHVCDVELGVDEGDPGFLPGLCTFDDLDYGASALFPSEECT